MLRSFIVSVASFHSVTRARQSAGASEGTMTFSSWVPANDLGGAAKTLFSLDDETSASASTKNYAPADLLVKAGAYSGDFAGMVGTGDRSALGARI
ncbi:hypothetical protein XH81_28890 [Bradyrhizobium sp. CCBAU 25360]|nr:hypothetical protein [Bradyrhizobium sp. CCBAU 25360]